MSYGTLPVGTKKTRTNTLIRRKPQLNRDGAANFVGLPPASEEALPQAG
jgi:hypothetical protein